LGLTVLGEQQVSVDSDYRVLCVPAVKTSRLAPWNSLGMDSQTTSDKRGTAPNVILTAANSEHAIAPVRYGAADLGFIESPAHLGITQPCRGKSMVQ